MSEIKDNVFKQWIASTIRQALKDYLGDQLSADEKSEVWLDKKGVCLQFGFTSSWFDHNCQFLPRQKPDGCKYVYPRNKIQQMFKDGRIKTITTNSYSINQ